MEQNEQEIPNWLLESQDYEPRRDRDGFIAKSMLSITGVLAQFRLDDGAEGRLSPSAPMKLLFALGCILLTSLSANYFFVLIMLACVLVRLCFLPGRALKRTVAVAFGAAGITFLIMLPAMLTGSAPASVLSTGVLVLPILLEIGVSKDDAAAIIALGSLFGMVAPPVNVPAMLIGTGVYMPYEGFAIPLLFLTLPLAIFSVLYIGRRSVSKVDNLPFRRYDPLYENTASNFRVCKRDDVTIFGRMHVIAYLLGEHHVPRLDGVFHRAGWDFVGHKNEQAQ